MYDIMRTFIIWVIPLLSDAFYLLHLHIIISINLRPANHRERRLLVTGIQNIVPLNTSLVCHQLHQVLMQTGEVLQWYYPEISTQSHTRIILSFSIQIQTFFVSSSRRVQEKIPDRWPLAHSGLWNTIGETENYTIRRQYNTSSHLYWQSLILSRKRKFQFNFSTWLAGGIVNWSKKCPLAILWQLPIANRIQQNSG